MPASIDKVKNRPGRPRVDSEQVTVRLERGLITKLDAWRADQPDTPGRPEAIRRLVDRALGEP